MIDLTTEQCRELVSRNRLCVLSLSDAGEPYAIPLFYGFDGETLYFGISEGLKTRILDANPRVCANVTEVGWGDSWSSVLVFGEARRIDGPEERARAVRVLMDHNRKFRSPDTESQSAAGAGSPAASAQRPSDGDASPGPRAQRAHGSGRIYSLQAGKITGKAKE